MKDKKLIMFDLDGTLSESADGIRKCLILTLNEMGVDVPELNDYTKYIGPPMFTTLTGLCGLNEEQANEGVKIYIKHYIETGMYINRAYDGIPELLQKLRDKGKTVAVTTSKNEKLAIDVLKHIGLYDYFDFICGSGLDGTRKKKQEVIEYTVNKLKFDKKDCVMIGDTKFDAEGAAAAGCDFIGVLYGYGVKAQMEQLGARVFASDVAQLGDILL